MTTAEALTHVTDVSYDELEKRFVLDSRDAAEELSDFLYKAGNGGAMYGPYIKPAESNVKFWEVSISK